MYSYEEVMDYCTEEDVRFIRLAFCDVHGVQKNISVMPDELRRAFECGVSIDASAIDGFGTVLRSDLFLHPDPSTLAVLPWRPSNGRVVRMFCDICYPDGTHFERDCRYILKQAVKKAADMGIHCFFGPEMEFYLFKIDENGDRTSVPFDNAGYMDIAPEDRGENIRREICFNLLEMGIKPESSHHEEGPGQNEIDFHFSGALNAADNAVTFKSVVRTVAMQSGLYADFSPKPMEDHCGNGMHINMSIKSDDGADKTNSFMAGILAHIKEITCFLNPTEQSYKRLGGFKAPKYITWSPENRSQLIRIPAAAGEYKRIELRSPDPAANVYLAFAMIIYSGLDGIERSLTPPRPVNVDLYTADSSVTGKLDKLPESLNDAVREALDSRFVRSLIPSELII